MASAAALFFAENMALWMLAIPERGIGEGRKSSPVDNPYFPVESRSAGL
jgi:hypothetical protein